MASRPLYQTFSGMGSGWLLFLLLMSGAAPASGQNVHSLTPAEPQPYVVEPGEKKDVDVSVTWVAEDVDVVTGMLDGSTPLDEPDFSAASASSPGTATFSLDTEDWSEGRHTVVTTSTDPSGNSSTATVEVFIRTPSETIIAPEHFLLVVEASVIPLPEGTVSLSVQVTNDSYVADCLCHWKTGDSDSGPFAETVLPDDFPVTFTPVFDTPGSHEVSFYCFNEASEGPDDSEATMSTTITVLGWEMSDFVLDYPEVFVVNGTVPDSDSVFALTLQTITKAPPGITANVTFGDGGPPEIIPITELAISHRFPWRGEFSGTVYLEHTDKGNVTLDFSVRVGLVYLNLTSDPAGGLVSIDSVGFDFRFVGPVAGTAVLDYGDGSATNSFVLFGGSGGQDIIHNFIYNNVGHFTATVKIWYNIGPVGRSYEEAAFPGLIKMDTKVDSLVLTFDPETVLTPPGAVTATMTLERNLALFHVECIFYFADDQKPEPVIWEGGIAGWGSFDVLFEYSVLGSHDVVVNCSNLVSEVTVPGFVFCYHPCFSDDTVFDRQYNILNPMMVMSSTELLLVTRTIIYCPIPSFWWEMEELNLDGSFKTDMTEQLIQDSRDFRRWEPGALAPGFYKFSVNITFGPESNNTWFKGWTFVRILRSPLVADFDGGSLRMTGDPNEMVNGYTLSYDTGLGLDNKTGLEFRWECETYNTATYDELAAIASQPLPVNLSSNCDDVSTEVLPGRRQLRVASSVSTVGYLFKMLVAKENKTSKPTAVFVQFNRASFPILLRCHVNCEKKTAITSQLLLSILCPSCTYHDLMYASYTWSISQYHNGTLEELSDPRRYFHTKGTWSGQSTSIRANSLDPCSIYRVTVLMKSLTGLDAAGSREFRTNCPPWGGNCTVIPKAGHVVTGRFTFICEGWQDDGFDEYNTPDGRITPDDALNLNGDDDELMAEQALTYKFLLRKNGVTIPIAQSGESTMPRVQMPYIVRMGGGVYDVIARVYDVLQDYTEMVSQITLNVTGISDTDPQGGETMDYWSYQVKYSNNASTLDKQLRTISSVSGILSTVPISEDRSPMEIAAEDNNASVAVVDDAWNNLWHSLNNPIPNPAKDEMTKLTNTFSSMVQERGNDSDSLKGQGVVALGEGLAAALNNPETTDDDSVLKASDSAKAGTDALEKLYKTVPYPVGDKLDDAVFSMVGLVERLVASSIPSYDLSLGADLLFNATDVGDDDSKFMVSRMKVADAVKDRRKMNTSRTAVPKLTQAVDTMLETLLSGLVLGLPQKNVQRGDLTLAATKTTGSDLANSTVSAGSLDLMLDSVNGDGSESDPDQAVDVKASVYEKNPFAWSKDGSSYEVTSPVVKVDMRDANGTRKLRKMTLSLKRGSNTPVPVVDIFTSNDTREGPDGFIFHRMTLRSGSSAVVTRFQLPSDQNRVEAYFRTGKAPTSSRYDTRVTGEPVQENRRRRSTGGGGGVYQFFVPPGSLSPGIVFVGFYLPDLALNATADYGYSSFSDMCRVWDEEAETWDTTSCSVSPSSSPEATVCVCSNPPGTSFASSFFVAPNTIDFSTVFSKFDLTNASVYGTLLALFCLWLLVLLWARRKDRQDKQRWMVGYLKDNHVLDRNFYLLTVYTGMRRGAGTKSNVRFVMTGKEGQSRVRLLSDGERSLSTASVLSYVMSTDSDIGSLLCLRLWHDDSGKDNDASWYLSRVVIEDLRTGDIYNFICEQWFSLDKDDGLIDRVVPVVLKDDALAFDKLFSERARMEITDSHLWLSCFLRPDRSTFTRVQRVSCCFALLLLTMITSALFYKAEDDETGASNNNAGREVRIGPLRFSLTTVWTSFVSIIITTIPMFVFVVLFRSYRPLPGPKVTVHRPHSSETRIARILKKMSKKEEHNLHAMESGLPSKSSLDASEGDTNKVTEGQIANMLKKINSVQKPSQNQNKTSEDEIKDHLELMEVSEKDPTSQDKSNEIEVSDSIKNAKESEASENLTEENKTQEGQTENGNEENLARDMARQLSDLLQSVLQQNPLPRVTLYVTWALLMLTILLCAFFMILYSMQWGATTSEEWLAAFFLSFFESFFLLDPIKVVLLACMLAYCAGNPYTSTQYQFVDLHRVQKEVQCCGSADIDNNITPPLPEKEEVLEEIRKRRKEEKLATKVFMELILYMFFVFCIFSVSYGNRDERSFLVNRHIEEMLYTATGNAPFPFEQISSRDDVMRYVKETVNSTGFPWVNELGDELTWRQRLYASDRVSFRVGPVRIRQVRTPAVESLKVTRWFPELRSSEEIHPAFSIQDEERGSYCLGWAPAPCSDADLTAKLSVSSWSYTADVMSVSIWGTHAFYGSGGYVADLTVNRDVVAKMAEELDENKWLDPQTRAVFVEMCLYNPNTNLFTFLRMAVEFPEFGASVVWKDLKTLRLYQHVGAVGAFLFVCELLVLLFIILFTVKLVFALKAQKWNYFKDVWQLLDLVALAWAYVAMVFYITKVLAVADTMELWRYNPKVYVDFYLPVLWDSIYGYILAALVFVVTIRLLRVLGYNQRVTMLATVLARSGPALLGYSVMFFVIVTAYMTAGHVLFLTTLPQFRSILDSYSTLYVVLLGTNRIGHWIQSSPLWAQAFFISFTFIILFVCYSMFEAILCNATSQVKAHLDTLPPPYGLTNVLAKLSKSIFSGVIPQKFKSPRSAEEPVAEEVPEEVPEDDSMESGIALFISEMKVEVRKIHNEMEDILRRERAIKRRIALKKMRKKAKEAIERRRKILEKKMKHKAELKERAKKRNENAYNSWISVAKKLKAAKAIAPRDTKGTVSWRS